MSKHWVKSTKKNNPRDTIWALRNPLENIHCRVTRSDNMVKLARDYYKKTPINKS